MAPWTAGSRAEFLNLVCNGGPANGPGQFSILCLKYFKIVVFVGGGILEQAVYKYVCIYVGMSYESR